MIRNRNLNKPNSQRGLNQLIRLYERNYQKLIKFFPEEKNESKIDYLIPEGLVNSQINISCRKLSNHTSVIHISKTRSIELIPNTEIEIYLYHDAKMAEVRKFNVKKQFWLRNKYPNKNIVLAYRSTPKFYWPTALYLLNTPILDSVVWASMGFTRLYVRNSTVVFVLADVDVSLFFCFKPSG